jgi:hypothetical protein
MVQMGDVFFCMKLLMVSMVLVTMDEMAMMQRHVITSSACASTVTSASELARESAMPAITSGIEVESSTLNGSVLAGTFSQSSTAQRTLSAVKFNSGARDTPTQANEPGATSTILSRALPHVESKGCQTDLEGPWSGTISASSLCKDAATSPQVLGEISSGDSSGENRSIDALRGEVSLLHAKLDAILAALADPVPALK